MFLLVFATSDAAAAIAFVKFIGTDSVGTTATTLTVTVPAGGVAANNKVVVALAIDPAVGATSCTDTGGNTYVVDADVSNGSGTSGVRAVVLSALVTTPLGAGDTITVTFPSVDAAAVSVNEFSGVSTLDQTASGTGNTVAATTAATAPTNQADELLFGVYGTEAKKTDPFTPGASYTGLTRENSGVAGPSSDNVTINPEYRVVAVTGSYVADASISNHEWAGAIATYRAVACANGVAEPGEQCDDGNLLNGDCCSATCLFEVAGTSCRVAAGVCDLAETCTGASGTCPPDGKSTAECRPVADVCDVAESCDGVADACPADGFAATTTVCRAAAGVCDVADHCPGAGSACPADAKSAAECRPVADACDVAESCDGVADDCPADVFAATTTVCRVAAGVCDVADHCTGAGSACPADAKSTAECRAVADVCDVAESCDGVADACPADGFAATTTVCRVAAGVCDVADHCTGAGSTCPADAKSTAECRPVADVCDVAESCDGIADACPADAFAPTTTVCRPTADVCDVAESCDGLAADCPADTGKADGDGDGVCDLVDDCPVTPDAAQVDGDQDGLGDACDPCTNVVPVFAVKPKVKIGKLTTAGGAKLRFKGVVTVPTSPPIDPATNGVRILLVEAAGAPMLDVTIPGTIGWKANAARTTWRYKNPAGLQSIVGVRIRAVRATPGRLKFRVVGRHGTYPMSPSGMPVKGTIVIDAPVARTGQCGEALFPGSPAPTCKLKAAGTVLRCR